MQGEAHKTANESSLLQQGSFAKVNLAFRDVQDSWNTQFLATSQRLYQCCNTKFLKSAIKL
ncbi:hypothetical protein ACU8KH_01605 [Lachancea thermotolerans]